MDEYNTFLPELMLRACDLDRTDGWKLAIARLASISYTGPVLGRSVRPQKYRLYLLHI